MTVACAIAAVLVGLAPAMYALTARPSAATTCTAGTEWNSASVLVAAPAIVSLYRIMPAPPASNTARLLSTSAMPWPRRHNTTLPATCAGSSAPVGAQYSAAIGSPPALTTFAASTSGVCGSAVANDEPLYVALLPRVVEPIPLRLCVPAATVVSQGPGCATVAVVGPLLPADVATNTPA